jgi:hypothetical protein
MPVRSGRAIDGGLRYGRNADMMAKSREVVS